MKTVWKNSFFTPEPLFHGYNFYVDVVNMARLHRDAWQSDFANSRNKSEHSGDYRDGTETYESREDAKRLFAQVCRTAETLTAYFSSYKLKRDWNIVELNPNITIFDEEKIYY